MREIKFRGFCERDVEWRNGFYVSDNKVHVINTILDCGSLYESIVDVDSLGEFTGLKDSNGIDIYEGDIIKRLKNCFFDEGYVNDLVVFKDGYFGCNGPLVNLVESFKPVVIGNIYENPELLEVI